MSLRVVIQYRLASTGLLSPCERSVQLVGEDHDVKLNNAKELI
jgi:hypothetical protein